MNFFQHQQQSRTASRRLITLFILAVVAIVAAIDGVVWGLLSLFRPVDIETGVPLSQGNHTGLLLGLTAIILLVIGLSSLIRVALLRRGGSEVARALGAELVPEDTRDPALRRLRNVVEEMAIASGVPVPQIHLMEDEPGINAFAAGYSPNDAVIAVTRGALEHLNRDELQAVIAHEFSHILNGDMRLNIHLMGVLFGIMVLGIIGRRGLEYMRLTRDARAALPIAVLAIVLTILGAIGVFFGRLIKAGISRSRESLADASAVQFTRQTQGLVGALKKIAGLSGGSQLKSAGAEEVSHMLFGEGLRFSSWFATHPPILERIKALDPYFDVRQFDAQKARWMLNPPNAQEEDLTLGFAPDGTRLAAGIATLDSATTRVPLAAEQVRAQVGNPGSDDLSQASTLTQTLDDELRRLTVQPTSAMAVVFTLLLDADDSLRQRQLALIHSHHGAEITEQIQDMQPRIVRLHPRLRLPLAMLAFPRLRRLPRPELSQFLRCCEQLIACDGKVSLFQYCLGRLLRRQVVEALDPARHAPNGRRKLASARNEAAIVLAVLAQYGHARASDAQRAFMAGITQLFPEAAIRYQPPTDFVQALETALPVLDTVEPMGKALLVEGLVAAIDCDGEVSVTEAELLRTLCAVLHCPLPALLDH